jgi:hypothetical protein
VNFTARVLGAGPSAARPGDYVLYVLQDGGPLLAAPVVGDDLTLPFAGVGPGRYRLQLQRESAIEAVSSPIYVEPAPAPYPRPGGATPLRVPLVPEFSSCTEPNSAHVPPLSSPSCAPPVAASSLLTTSAVGRGQGFARFTVRPGDPSTAEDEADVEIAATASDIRTVAGPDYDGSLLLSTTVRMTDNASGAAGNEPATVQDFRLSAPVDCVPTADPGLGSSCPLSTSADSMLPGIAREGTRSVMSAFSVILEDAGPDGSVGPSSCVSTCGTGDEAVFLRQGIFLP